MIDDPIPLYRMQPPLALSSLPLHVLAQFFPWWIDGAMKTDG
jgi:hypothetical protein